MSLETLKLNKQIESAMHEAGYTSAREIQAKTMSRILGGQDLIAVSPEGSGKSTAIVIGVLMRLKFAEELPPRALILVPNKEKVADLTELFTLLGKFTNVRVLPITSAGGMEGQREALAEGTDVVIGTPDRILTLYQKSAINISKLKMFILDDAEQLLKLGFQNQIHLINESLNKCQHLVFTEVYHSKLQKLTDPIMNYPTLIEVKEEIKNQIPVINNLIYKVPNYKTKLNLLNLLLKEADIFFKVIVFANTSYTAEKLFKSLNRRIAGEVATLNLKGAQTLKLSSIDEFLSLEEIRVLIASNEEIPEAASFNDITYILHFDVPANKEILIDRIKLQDNDAPDERQAITFVTDLELNLIKKTEAEIGSEFFVEELPFDLIIEGDPNSKRDVDSDDRTEAEKGSAFHEKKASNAKDYNLKYKDRLRMFGKKNRKNKRGPGI